MQKITSQQRNNKSKIVTNKGTFVPALIRALICFTAPSMAFADVFLGCSLLLPPTLVDSCDYINSQLALGTLRHQFSVDGGINSFDIDSAGQAHLKVKVITLAANGAQGSSDATYEFRVQDVYFLPPPHILIECIDNTNCIKFSGTGLSSSAFSSTALISDEKPELMQELAKSFAKIRGHFCDPDKC